jgi:hypothetical protein
MACGKRYGKTMMPGIKYHTGTPWNDDFTLKISALRRFLGAL